MMQEHRGFKIYGDAEPVLEALLGRISQWHPKGSINYAPPDHSLVELTRFRFPAMTFDEPQIAEFFGLEIGRLFVDCCYRELVMMRYESEKRRIPENRRHRH